MSKSTEKQNRIETGPMEVALLNEVAERLLHLERLLESEHPKGAIDPIEGFIVTEENRQLLPKSPWFSVSVINDGPNDVFCIVNAEKSQEEHKIVPSETYSVSMKTAIICDLLFHCNTGETASLRVVGVR